MDHRSELDRDEISSKPLPGRALFVVVLAIVVGGSVWWACSRRGRKEQASGAAVPLNARAGVRFVGDAACIRCHEGIAKSYRLHPMGRSILPIEEAPSQVHGEATERTLFSDQGFDYSLQKCDGRTMHRETKRNRAGKVIGQVEGEVRYVLGSGSHARAFLIERDDYLFQSPITWYAQENRWSLAPSYENRVGASSGRSLRPAWCATRIRWSTWKEPRGGTGRQRSAAIRSAASDAMVRESCTWPDPRSLPATHP